MGVWMGAIAERFRATAAEQKRKGPGAWTWPNAEYRDDPVRFCNVEMGVDLLEYQVEMVEAVRDYVRVANRGGRKVGKDFVMALVAWWFFCTFPGARVRFISPNAEQSRDVFWRELQQRWAESGRCLDCKRNDPGGPRPCPHAHAIPDVPALRPETGVRANVRDPGDFREIVGFTATSREAAAGVSGGTQLWIIDEASDVDDFVHEAIDGNIGGSAMARIVLMSQPTKNIGRFYDAFHSMQAKWRLLHWSSRNSPNVLAGRMVVNGLAGPEWIRDSEELYGPGSGWVKHHIDGDFVDNPEGTVFPLESIDASNKLWPTALRSGAALQIGIDVAGASERADASGFAIRRGDVILECYTRQGLNPDGGGHLVEALGLFAKHRQDGDDFVVCVDAGGDQGSRALHSLNRYLLDHEGAFHLVAIYSSHRAKWQGHIYEHVRDVLVANLADWVRGGGALPVDAKLRDELHTFRWVPQPTGRSKLLKKEDQRKLLGRSPDLADAVALATWRPTRRAATAEDAPPAAGIYDRRAESEIDPYAGVGPDPYAGERR